MFCCHTFAAQRRWPGQGILEALNDGRAKQGFPPHGDAVQNGPGKVCVEVDLSTGIGLVDPIPGGPHCGLHKGVWRSQ